VRPLALTYLLPLFPAGKEQFVSATKINKADRSRMVEKQSELLIYRGAASP
jgi:hypothetical protein